MTTPNPAPCFRFIQTVPDAPAPQRVHATDAGFDLSLVRYVKTVDEVDFYDTGIAVAPAPGYYFELVPRSSISKTGYMLANSIGIIDADYRGSILVALRRMTPDTAPLVLPCRLVQLIPRQQLPMIPQLVETLDTTARGDGGFGSTGSNSFHPYGC